MSFRLFVFYSALCGGCAAFLGWVLGRILSPDVTILSPRIAVTAATLKGMALGMTIAFGLSLLDAVWALSWKQPGKLAGRVAVAVVIGSLGGLLGGCIGQALFGVTDFTVFLILGWTFTGLLIGSSIGMFEFVNGLIHSDRSRGLRRKVINGLVGGGIGGLVGGILSLFFRATWASLLHNKPADRLWSPSAVGFVALGLCIGLLIGLAQLIFKEAWVRVEKGFRPGRELILARSETTIGRAETCDIGLYGDSNSEKLHARILLRDRQYFLADAGTTGGTCLNGRPVSEPTPLRAGDLIGIGNSILRFQQR